MGKHIGPIEKKCKECGKIFLELKSGKKFCSDGCYDEWCRKRAPVTKACVVCGNEFTLSASAMKNRFCCSRECGSKRSTVYDVKRFICEGCGKEIYSKSPRKFCSRSCIKSLKVDKRKCPVCGNGKSVKNKTCKICNQHISYGVCKWCGVSLKKRGKVFCSDECSQIHRSTNAKRHVCVCAHCGKEFGVIPSHRHAKFCSKECNWEHARSLAAQNPKSRKRNRKGISNQQRFRVLERDKYKCVYCGATPEQCRLVVDHIYPQSKLTKSAGNMNVNLVTACEKCNNGKSDRKIECLPDAVKARISEYLIKEGYKEGETVVQ